MMAGLKRKPVFGGGQGLKPIHPTPEEEQAIAKVAVSQDWTDRGTKRGDEVEPNGSGSEPKKPSQKKAPPKLATKKSKETPTAKKPARRPPVSEEFPDLVQHYMEIIASGEPLPSPPNPMWKKVDRHRIYAMFPVHTAAALHAFSDSKGYRQLWMAIDELLREAGLYGENHHP